MELVWKIAALCLSGTVLAALLRTRAPEMSAAFLLGLLLCGAALLAGSARDLAALAETLLSLTGLRAEWFLPLLKTLVIALTVRIGGAFCRDASQSALAALLEASGAVCALIVAAPLLRAVISLLEEWL